MSTEQGCLSVAIVGAGPAGFYAADALLRKPRECRIDILDRLPTPYGLVRSGVAPDHQSTKNVVRVFDRILRNDAVRLLGNVEMGRDVAYGELKALYDVVVLALGAQVPRRLGIPGESLAGAVDSTGFVDWYNAVPGARDLAAELDARTAVVVGNGNVALDVARLLAKTGAELAAGDIDPRAAEAIAGAPLADIHVVGRRGPLHAAFTSPDLAELGKLAQAAPVVDRASLPDSADSVAEDERTKKAKNLRILKNFAAANGDADPRPVKVRLVFFASPVEILGEDRVGAVRFERNRIVDGRAVGTGETFEIEAQLFVSAIGYRVGSPDGGPPVDERRGIIANDDGRVEPGVYVVGWARRGPTGVIGTNRNDAREVVERVAADALPGGRPGPGGLDRLLAERGARIVTTDGWRRIDEAEIAAASGDPQRPRVKFTSIDEMLAAAAGGA
jgi:ferredoxin--NADP+ reductase